MSFREDVEAVSGLGGAFRAGLQALTGPDQRRLTVSQPRRLSGSVHIDAALAERHPQSARWDYTVAKCEDRDEQLHWIEVHSAGGSTNMDEVFAKLDWLLGWLTGEGVRLARYRHRFIWIATGHSGFRAGSPQSKKIANRGIYFAGRHYVL